MKMDTDPAVNDVSINLSFPPIDSFEQLERDGGPRHPHTQNEKQGPLVLENWAQGQRMNLGFIAPTSTWLMRYSGGCTAQNFYTRIHERS